MTDQRSLEPMYSPNYVAGYNFYLSAVQAASEAFMADRTSKIAMKVYVDGLRQAQVLREVEIGIAAAGKPSRGESMAHAYCHGFFAAIDQIGERIFQLQIRSDLATQMPVDEAMRTLLADVESAAKSPAEIP